MEEEKFFYYLLKKTGEVFKSAPICEYQISKGFNWNYAVCETPIQKNKGVLFGLNWGGDNISAQTQHPKSDKKNRKWNFMSTSRKYFSKYLNVESENELNYSNLCFFRSPNTDPLNDKDWSLSMPLFEEYIHFINPPWTVLMGTTGIDILKIHKKLSELERLQVDFNGKRNFAFRGKLFDKYDFFCVPHPQAKLVREVRESLWDKLFQSHVN